MNRIAFRRGKMPSSRSMSASEPRRSQRPSGRALTPQEHVALGRCLEARQTIDQGGLARPIGANEAKYLMAPNHETDVGNCSQTLEADNETLGRQFCSIGATQGRSRQGL